MKILTAHPPEFTCLSFSTFIFLNGGGKQLGVEWPSRCEVIQRDRYRRERVIKGKEDGHKGLQLVGESLGEEGEREEEKKGTRAVRFG